MTPSVCCQRRQPLATVAGRPDDLLSSCKSDVFARVSESDIFVLALRSSSSMRPCALSTIFIHRLCTLSIYTLCSLRHSAVNVIALVAIEKLLPKIGTQSISLEIEREYNNQLREEGKDEHLGGNAVKDWATAPSLASSILKLSWHGNKNEMGAINKY